MIRKNYFSVSGPCQADNSLQKCCERQSLVLETVRGMKGVAMFHADLFCVRDTTDLCRRLTASAASRRGGLQTERVIQ